MSYIYLASPYTAKTYSTRRKRYNAALAYVVEGHKAGVTVYSPIVYSKGIAKKMPEVSTDYTEWQRSCEDMINGCRVLAVLKLHGWRKSVGVQAEIAYATSIGKEVVYVDVETT